MPAPNSAFHEAACKFVDLVTQQAGTIERALFADARDDELRRRRKELQASSQASGEGYRLPTGETIRLIGEFNAWDCDDGEFAEALQAVNAQICGTNSPEINLVKSIADSHRAYLLGAREAFYESRLEVAFALRLEHFNNIAALKEAVGYIVAAEVDADNPPKTPAVARIQSTPKLSAVSSALAYLVEHRGENLTISGVAKAVGKHRSTLHRCEQFMAAWKVHRRDQVGRARRHRKGFKDSKTGELDAFE